MNAADTRAQLEADLTWRADEIRLLRNGLGYLTSEGSRMIYRKCLIVMLYAHLEGFVRTSFSIYLDAVSALGLKRDEVNEYLAAASMDRIFRAYDDRDAKCRVFNRALPYDAKLHGFARQVEFVSRLTEFLSDTVKIPEDVVITNDNVWPYVIRKLLYRVGFPPDAFEAYEGQIHRLVNTRNAIAHGLQKKGLSHEDYTELESGTLSAMGQVRDMLAAALSQQAYRKSSAGVSGL